MNNLDQLQEHYQSKINLYKDQLSKVQNPLNKSLLQDKLNAAVSGYLALGKLRQLNAIDSNDYLSVVEKVKAANKVYASQLM